MRGKFENLFIFENSLVIFLSTIFECQGKQFSFFLLSNTTECNVPPASTHNPDCSVNSHENREHKFTFMVPKEQ